MAVMSMTGFARASDQHTNENNNETTWAIELRSVNGKGMDLRMRMPNSLEPIDQQIRKHFAKHLSRGNVTLNINVKSQDRKGAIELNREAFTDLLNAAKTAAEISNLPMPSLDALLSMRNVLQEQECQEDEEETQALQEKIFTSIGQALEGLLKARQEEGEKLEKVINERLIKIDGLIGDAIDLTSNQREQIKKKLKDNIKLLLDQSDDLDESRLNQEAVLLAVKADISEELDRLKAHVEQAQDLMSRKEPIGRRMDFLCQEFNREANTLCSKSQTKELTYIGLELKTLIDQLREQVQNIE